jgi:pSer/pThr/pTyr-binding forkhead associated (FHA) protein
MGPISRFFGRKDDEPSAGQEGSPEAAKDEVQPETTQVSKKTQADNGQEYGLKFILPSGKALTLTSLPISIGRSDQNDIVLKDETVSARHAQIYYDDLIKDVCILDNDSLNGLFIDDQPTRKNVLYDGVKIRLGGAEITFRDTGYIHVE